MQIWEAVLFFLVLIVIIISAILIGLASKKLIDVRGYSNSPNLQTATTWYNWASTIVWLAAVLTVIILMVFLYQSAESDIHRHNFGTHSFTRVALWILLIMLAVAVIFLFVGYEYMRRSTSFTQGVIIDPNINTFIVTAMIMLGAAFLAVLIIVVFSLFRTSKLHEDELDVLREKAEMKFERSRLEVEEGY